MTHPEKLCPIGKQLLEKYGKQLVTRDLTYTEFGQHIYDCFECRENYITLALKKLMDVLRKGK